MWKETEEIPWRRESYKPKQVIYKYIGILCHIVNFCKFNIFTNKYFLKKYNKIRIVKHNSRYVSALYFSAPECHLQGVCEHKWSQVQHSTSGINWICDSLCSQIPCRWQSDAVIRRGDAYHKLCVIVCVLLYFIKCNCWSIYWIYENAQLRSHKIR